MKLVNNDGSDIVEVRPVTKTRSFVPRRWRYDPVTGCRIPLADGESAYPNGSTQ